MEKILFQTLVLKPKRTHSGTGTKRVFSSSNDDYLFLALLNLKHAHILRIFSCFTRIVSSSRIRRKLVCQSNQFFVPLPNLQLHSRIEASSSFPSIYPLFFRAESCSCMRCGNTCANHGRSPLNHFAKKQGVCLGDGPRAAFCG